MNEEITASITFDEPTMLAGLRWYSRMHRRAALVRFALLFVAGMMISASFFMPRENGQEVFSPGFLVLPALGVALAAAGVRDFVQRRYFLSGVRSSPLFGKAVTYKTAGDMVEVTSPHSQSSVSWQMFSQSVETPEGLLLLQNKRVFNWLPKTAFTTDADYARFRDLAAAGTKHSKIG